MFTKKAIAILMSVLIAIFTACGDQQDQGPPDVQETEEVKTEAPVEAPAETPTEPPKTEAPPAEPVAVDRPLVISTGDMNGRFSPFTGESAYDITIVDRVLGDALIMYDRLGELVFNGLEGETRPYNGTDYFYDGLADGEVARDEDANTTTYRLTMRRGVKFSDGQEMTIDDYIFSVYAFVDPSYTGSSTLYSVPIQGLREYRQGYEDAASSFRDVITAIREAGPDGAAESDSYTADMHKKYWDGYNASYRESVEAIVSYVYANYSGYIEDIKPDVTDLDTNAGLQTALGMYVWGYADPGESGGIIDAAGNEYDLETTYPTIDDYVAVLNDAFDTGYIGASEEGEFDGVAGAKSYDTFVAEIINELVAANPDLVTRSVTNISGINRVNDYEAEIIVDGYDASAVFKLFQIHPVPLHYYGDKSKYNFADDRFGFEYGDTSFFSKTETKPMGAGPYKFVKYENKVVYLEANENYWRGAPIIKEIQYRVTSESDNIPGIQTGTIDIANVSMNMNRADQIRQINGGELTGSVITYVAVKNLGYGYIGINAKNVSVNGERSSEASRNLRKGIATILANFRDLTVSTFYGDLGNVINYPMSETSWAAPQRTDPGYAVAYSKDVNGNEIYSSGMSEDKKEEAAKQAALGFFEAAGYSVSGGKVTAAPSGSRTTFDMWIPAGGEGDHPSFLLLTKSKEALEDIGITLNIRDLPDQSSGDLWDGLDAETVDMWCAAWQATLDPDIYQLYHSDGLVGSGTGSNAYGIDNPTLDELIIATRANPDNDERKALFLEAFNVILDEGVEVPVYQRDNCMIFSTERVDTGTLPGDMTTYYEYNMGIEDIGLR